VTAWLTAATLLASGGAVRAQAQPAPARKYKPQPLMLQKEQLGSENLANIGRARMRKGDFAGALDAFDAALRSSTEPTFYRDRGLCHEKLGDAYPAIDDFRAYLTAAPDAPDADGIRERLERLEGAASDHKSAAPSGGGGDASGARAHGASGTMAVYTKLDYVERDDDPLHTPLRKGRGWSVAPFFAEHKWFFSGRAFDDRETWAECVGLQGRWSVSSRDALVLEVGFEHFNSTSLDTYLISGLTSQLAYELRLPLDADYNNQLLLSPGLGFEHLVFSATDPSQESDSFGAFVVRGRVAFRHMIDTNAGVEAGIDAGAANFFLYKDFPYDSNGSTTPLVAVNVAVVWGL
jgi:tetratricopeptide (TPR) repeat protein